MSKQTLITSRDPKGLQFVSLCEAVYNKAKLDEGRAQRLNERGGELRDGLSKLIQELTLSDRYADEEVNSGYTYPKGYNGPRPIGEQVDTLAKIFGLSLDYTSEFIEKVLPTLTLPNGAEGWFAIPRWDKLGSTYCEATGKVLATIESKRKFYNYHKGDLTPNRFRLNARTAHALDLLAEQQKGDIWIVGAQFGKRHAGRSVRRAREVFAHPEFGAHTVAVGSMLLIYPKRIVSYNDLWTDVPGDEFDLDGDGSFDGAPCFGFYGGKVEFAPYWTSFTVGRYGSVSLFLTQ